MLSAAQILVSCLFILSGVMIGPLQGRPIPEVLGGQLVAGVVFVIMTGLVVLVTTKAWEDRSMLILVALFMALAAAFVHEPWGVIPGGFGAGGR